MPGKKPKTGKRIQKSTRKAVRKQPIPIAGKQGVWQIIRQRGQLKIGLHRSNAKKIQVSALSKAMASCGCGRPTALRTMQEVLRIQGKTENLLEKSEAITKNNFDKLVAQKPKGIARERQRLTRPTEVFIFA